MRLLLIFFLHTALGANAQELLTPPPIDTPTNRESVKNFLAIIKSLASNITGDNRQLFIGVTLDAFDVAFGASIFSSADSEKVEAIKKLERQVEEIGFDLTNSILEAKAICSDTHFEEISMKAGALFSLLLRAVVGLWEGCDVFVKIFLHSCRHVQPRFLIRKIPSILRNASVVNPMAAAMEADKFHKFSTISKSRTRILTTANTLAFVESFRVKFAEEEDLLKKAEAMLDVVDGIDMELNKFIVDYEKKDYFKEKVPQIIQDVIDNFGKGSDKSKAAALMKALREIHTRDRFVVVVYNDGCEAKRIVNGTASNLIIDDHRKTIVYRSMRAFSITTHDEAENLIVEKFKDWKYECQELTATDVMQEIKNSGLVILRAFNDGKSCVFIEQDARFHRTEHNVTCIAKWTGAIVENNPETVHSYPF